MGLDFTALNNIQLGIAKKDFTEPLYHEEGNLALQPERPATGQNTAPQGELIHSHRLDAEKQERARMREMYSTYQENIKRAGMLRADILKGISKGEDPLALLLQAVECISLMTGDTVILDQSKRDILAIYGWGLGEPAPIREELANTQHRLQRLENALTDGLEDREEERLLNAIKAHRGRINSLQRILARADHAEDSRSMRYASDIIAEIIDGLREKQKEKSGA